MRLKPASEVILSLAEYINSIPLSEKMVEENFLIIRFLDEIKNETDELNCQIFVEVFVKLFLQRSPEYLFLVYESGEND